VAAGPDKLLFLPITIRAAWYAMRRHRSNWLNALITLLLLIPAAGYAATSKKVEHAAHSSEATPSERLGRAEAWTAYTYKEKSGKVCYLAADPQRSERLLGKRRHASAMVTHRPGEKITNVVSFAEGYPLKEDSEVSLEIGGAKFDLFTKGDSAWARTAEIDKAIVEAMAKGKQAVVKGIPQKGSAITDTYSLAGFSQALVLIDKACEVNR
jgi:Invasion associated locus B (IalB) protein